MRMPANRAQVSATCRNATQLSKVNNMPAAIIFALSGFACVLVVTVAQIIVGV